VARLLTLSVAAVMIGAGVGVGLVAAWATVGAPTQCIPSEPITTLLTLTPVLIVNSPYGGYANGTLTIYANTSTQTARVTETTGARNGSVTYLLDRVNWTIWTTQRVGNPTGSCAGIFAYSEAPAGSVQIGLSTPENYTNDSQAPQFSGDGGVDSATGGPYSVLYFNDSYSRFSWGIGTCSGLGGETAASSSYLSYRIPFEYLGSPHVASVTVNELTNYTYWIPPGGNFYVDELSSPGGPGGGDSFTYLPCPS
jgi:hypothetical protein